MDFIKKHKLSAFIILVYIVVIVFGYFIYSLFIGSSGMPVYGERLDGIDKVTISAEQISNIETVIKKEENVVRVTKPYLSGKAFKVIITVKDTSEVAAAKALAAKIPENLNDEQKKFYDVEVFLNKDYNCTIMATGKMDEDGNFVDKIDIKFVNDLSSVSGLSYGLSNTNEVTYSQKQTYDLKDDGTHTIYGFVKDGSLESTCSLKVTKKASEIDAKVETIKSREESKFPMIGYLRRGATKFTWTNVK